MKNGLVRLVSEEVKNGWKLNFQRGQKLASETSLKRLENGFVRQVSEARKMG